MALLRSFGRVVVGLMIGAGVCRAGEVIEGFERDGVAYVKVRCEASQVRVMWKGADGKLLDTLAGLHGELERRGETPLVVMNGGIFEPGRVPSGLLVQDGKQLVALNMKDGKGNFFLKPNGVFLVTMSGEGRVVDAAAYASVKEGVAYAVQSGPLLLKGGKTHPVFRKESTWRLHRNGVGIDAEGKVVFVMTVFSSAKKPNLWEFADVFRSLGCEDALFLDGDLSQMAEGEAMTKASNYFASMIGVVAGE